MQEAKREPDLTKEDHYRAEHMKQKEEYEKLKMARSNEQVVIKQQCLRIPLTTLQNPFMPLSCCIVNDVDINETYFWINDVRAYLAVFTDARRRIR